jgi:hypothetical protein
MSNNVLDFEVLRIQHELDLYVKNRTLPHDLLEGVYSITSLKENYYHRLQPYYQKIADQLIKDYHCTIADNISSLKSALKKEYAAVIDNLETNSVDFKFPSVLVKYRPDINPVRALFYEIREILRSYNTENQYQQWLLGIVTDCEYNNKLVDALSVDIRRLEKIVSRYYVPLTQHDTNIPLELFHARQLIKDFRHYRSLFINSKSFEYE